ncbi:MAG: prolipoprotein diacylglyceryl transferase family protein [Solirubrobacterales bacterium]
MTALTSVITIGIDPTIELGPLTIAWHGLTIAIGIVVGGALAAYEARRRGLDPEPLYAIAMIVVLAALVGGRVFYLLEHGLLDEPSEWFSTTGFTFYGGFIAAALGIAYYIRRWHLSLSYLDAIAAALPLGVAVGRIGDVINGEHYGPASEFFLAVRNTHPEALTPSPELAYHSGGLYEVLLASIVFAIAWPLRKRLRRPLALMWLVIALFAAGRFLQFFWRSDSAEVALGLETAQWTSLTLLGVAAVGAWLTLRQQTGDPAASATQE